MPVERSTLRLAHRVPCTAAEGPFLRYAIWVQGCSIRCAGCCNPGLFDAAAGTSVRVADLLERIERARADGVEGLTVVGGEPFEQPEALGALLRGVRSRGLGTLVFTGWTLSQLRRDPRRAPVLQHVDTLVDGPFDRERPEPEPRAGGRPLVGSTNQTVRHFTSRYADPGCWDSGIRAEIRIRADGQTTVVGAARDVAQVAPHLGR